MKTNRVNPQRSRIFSRRLILSVLTAMTTAIASYGMLRVLLVNGLHLFEWFILPLFVVLVIPIGLSFWTAVFGFIVQLTGGDELSLDRTKTEIGSADLGSFRTAIVIPAY